MAHAFHAAASLRLQLRALLAAAVLLSAVVAELVGLGRGCGLAAAPALGRSSSSSGSASSGSGRSCGRGCGLAAAPALGRSSSSCSAGSGSARSLRSAPSAPSAPAPGRGLLQPHDPAVARRPRRGGHRLGRRSSARGGGGSVPVPPPGPAPPGLRCGPLRPCADPRRGAEVRCKPCGVGSGRRKAKVRPVSGRLPRCAGLPRAGRRSALADLGAAGSCDLICAFLVAPEVLSKLISTPRLAL